MLPLNDSGGGGDNVIVSKKKKRNREGKTYVFEIQLTEYTNDSYAEYNWKELVKKEEERRIDPDIEIIEIDDDPVPKKKKVSEKIDPEDDYDLADDFIDDSEVNDEEVPDEVTTAYGGFYINVGSLKFRYTSDDKGKTQAKDTSARDKPGPLPNIAVSKDAPTKSKPHLSTSTQNSITDYFGSKHKQPLPRSPGRK